MNRINIGSLTAGSSYQVKEAYKSLRTNIEFCGKDQKVIGITSCTPNEGKSTVSLNLAASISETGKRVLFIDADLRKSILLGQLDIHDRIYGMTNFLAGQCQVSDIIYATEYPSLHMILTGPMAPNPAELLGSTAFRRLLADLRHQYDYIIIDTPPLGSVIDTAIISKACDGIAMVIAANSISYRFAKKVQDQLERTDCKLLGVILNKVDVSDSYYGKYYGKYYGSYYGQKD